MEFACFCKKYLQEQIFLCTFAASLLDSVCDMAERSVAMKKV